MVKYTPYRYSVSLTSDMLRGKETVTLNIPAGGKFLSVGVTPWRAGEVQLWFLVDPNAERTKNVEVMVISTGFGKVDQDTLDRLQFLGTAVSAEVEEVYHCFLVHPKNKTLAMRKVG